MYELGMRCNATKNHLANIDHLEGIVKNSKEKRFKVFKDRIEKLINRGWIQIKIDDQTEDGVIRPKRC